MGIKDNRPRCPIEQGGAMDRFWRVMIQFQSTAFIIDQQVRSGAADFHLGDGGGGR